MNDQGNNEHQLLSEVERGRQAQDLLQHPLLEQFFTEAEQELWKTFKESSLRDADGREKLRLMAYWLEKFRAWLTTHVETGRMAQIQLQETRSLMERMKEAVFGQHDPW